MGDTVIRYEFLHVLDLVLLDDVISLYHVADNVSHSSPLFSSHISCCNFWCSYSVLPIFDHKDTFFFLMRCTITKKVTSTSLVKTILFG